MVEGIKYTPLKISLLGPAQGKVQPLEDKKKYRNERLGGDKEKKKVLSARGRVHGYGKAKEKVEGRKNV